MAELTLNMRIAIIAILLMIPVRFLHHVGVMEVMGVELASAASITRCVAFVALSIVLAVLMWRRSRWGFIGGVMYGLSAIILFPRTIVDVLSAALPAFYWLYTESFDFVIGIFLFFFGYRSYKELSYSDSIKGLE